MNSRRVDWLVSELLIMGGAESYVRSVAPRLRAVGWDLHVITLASGGELVRELRSEGVPVIELGVRHKADITAIIRLLRLWKSDRPALIHTHLFHAGVLGRLAARSLGLSPLIVHQHGLERARSRLRSILDRLLSPLAQQYVASCQAVARQLSTREAIPPEKLVVIYNGIDPSVFPRSQSLLSGDRPEWRDDFLKTFDLDPSSLHLACVGRLSPEKGQALLLEALSLLTAKGLRVQVVFFGEGPLRQALQERCAQLNLGAQVRFAGLRRDLHHWLPCFDLFALPSAWEGLSMALLEAMAAGLPVVATGVGGSPEVVVDGVTGLLVPPGDAAALANALTRLAQDPDLRHEMGAAGKQRVEAQFSLSSTVAALNNLYEELLSG